MKKLLSVIAIYLITLVCVFAKTEKITSQGYTCPYCNVQLVHMLVKVGEKKCSACGGKSWYGTHKTKSESREKGTLCDPCNYCDGEGVIPVKNYRWVCPKCKTRFNVN